MQRKLCGALSASVILQGRVRSIHESQTRQPRTHTTASISLQSTTAGVMHHTAVGAGVRAHHAVSPRVAGGCNNSHRGAAAAHLSPQNAAPNSARRGRSTPAHKMYTSGAPPPHPGICSKHPISSSVSRRGRGPMHGVQMGEGDAHPFACAPARIRLQGGQAAFFGAGRGRVVSPPRGVVPDRPPVPSVGGAVGTAARRPAPAGQLVIVIGELRGGVAALAAVSPRVVKCASSRADRLGKSYESRASDRESKESAQPCIRKNGPTAAQSMQWGVLIMFGTPTSISY